MIGTDVEIVIRDNETGSYLLLPVVPETFDYSDGEKQAETVQIVNFGAVDIPTGVELDGLSWGAFFPARYDASYCSHPDILTPISYRNIFSSWKDGGTSLQIVCPAFGLNKTMYLKTFSWNPEGYEGDIAYRVDFKEYKTITPKMLTVGEDAADPANKGAEERAASAGQNDAQSYTVQDGDTLSHIAKKLGIADWRALYDANKDVIGSDPNLIYPGQVYKVP